MVNSGAFDWDKADYHHKLNITKKKATRRQALNEATLDAVGRAIENKELYGIPLDHYPTKKRKKGADYTPHRILKGWSRRSAVCGDIASLKECEHGDHHTVTVNCCHVPVCAWEEKRTAAEMAGRTRLMMEYLPNSDFKKKRYVRYKDVKEFVWANGDGLTKKWAEPRLGDTMAWRMPTVNLRSTGSLLQDVDRTLDWVRRRTAEFLAKAGQLYTVLTMDVGNKNGFHVHLHGVCYGPMIPKERFESFVRSLDCTVSGCKHPPGGDGVCDGSWEGDLRYCYDPVEALKYICAWPDVSEGGEGFNQAQVELRLASYLVSYGRHRVECYQLAKRGVFKRLDKRCDDIGSGRECPKCGGAMHEVAKGTWSNSRYEWTLVRTE